MKIRNKILIYSVLIAIFSVLTIAADSFYNVDKNIITSTKNHLTAIADIQKSRFETLYSENILLLQQISNRTGIIEALASYNASPNNTDKELMQVRIKDAEQSAEIFENIAIIDNNFNLIVASNPETDISQYHDLQLLKDAFGKNTISVSQNTTGKKKLVIHGPIKKDNKTIGTIIIISNIKGVTNIIDDYSGMGETGEIIIASRNSEGDAEHIQPPRFGSENTKTIVSKNATNIVITQALQKNENLFTNLNDYRNKPVYSVTRYIPELDWGLVVKIDKTEIYAPVYSHAIQLGLINLGIIILIIFVALLLSNSIARPIEALNAGSLEITKGDFTHKIELDTKDEIGELAHSFNSMMDAIIASRAEIDKKVHEQTKEIIENQEDLDNQRKAILNILEDVEDEKNLTAREKDKVETILQSIGDAVFVVDNNYNILLVNQVTVDLSGLERDDLIGKKYSDVLKFVFENENLKLEKVNDKFVREAISTGKVQEMSNHTVLINAKGERIPVSDSAAPLKDKEDHIIGCVVVFRDVSKEYAVDKAKTEFVSLASHQLRTPLSAINWYTEMLINGDVGKMTPDQTKYLQEIYHGNQRMVDLVNALLNTSRIELGTFGIEPIMMDIVKSSDEIVKEMQIPAKEKKIDLTTNYKDKFPEILADPKIYQIIIQNLLSNAVKYTPEKGKVSLTIAKKDPNILIEVKDTGYGIPKAQQKEMFKKLFRADNVRAKDTEGTGLGLYIVKSIVEQSGGEIWFESEENKGTTFFVTFPVSGMIKKEGTKALEDIK